MYKQTQPEHQDPSEDDGMMVVDGVAARTTRRDDSLALEFNV